MKYANECISSQLDLFTLPSLDTSLEEGSWIYLEQQIKDGVELSALPLFTNAMTQTLATIEEFKLTTTSVTTSDSDSLLSSQELLPLLENLHPYLKNNDFLPESLLEPLRKIKSQKTIKSLLERLLNQVDAFDYNGALTTLEQIIDLISNSNS